MPERRELGSTAADAGLLRAFYDALYVPSFPDPDERESLASIERYLRLRAEGWYGRNAYHVRLLLEGGRPVAGSISDYLAEPNSGVIEFLVVAPEDRGRGLGRALLAWTEDGLAADARAAAQPGLESIVAEMNDPFRRPPAQDNVDPFLRLLVWGRWGYARLDFPYVQPALSAEQRPVTSMLLAMKHPGRAAPPPAVPGARVTRIVHEYLRWAMRIEVPDRCAEYRAMAEHLAGRETVALAPLDAYVGRDADRPLEVHEIADPHDADLDAVLRLYAGVFGAAATAADPATLRAAVADGGGRTGAWHLWALRARAGDPVAGMASFVTLDGFGFGGYVALAPPLRGTGRLPLLVARIEEQMLRDGRGATGWYVECDDGAAPALRRVGFHEVAVTYRQPPLRAGGEAPRLRLLYKAFGRTYAPPVLSPSALLDAVGLVYRVVYGIARPEEHPLHRALERQLAASGAATAVALR